MGGLPIEWQAIRERASGRCEERAENQSHGVSVKHNSDTLPMPSSLVILLYYSESPFSFILSGKVNKVQLGTGGGVENKLSHGWSWISGSQVLVVSGSFGTSFLSLYLGRLGYSDPVVKRVENGEGCEVKRRLIQLERG